MSLLRFGGWQVEFKVVEVSGVAAKKNKKSATLRVQGAAGSPAILNEQDGSLTASESVSHMWMSCHGDHKMDESTRLY